MNTGFDRYMKLFACVGKDDNRPTGKRLVYTFSTLANERQLADDLAGSANMRNGEGYVVIFDMADDAVLNKLDLPS